MFAMGLIAGIFGIIAAIFAIFVGGVDAAFSSDGTSSIFGLGVSAMLFSILGIVGAAMSKPKPKVAGVLMVISGIAGFISISFFYILSGILFIIGGFMGILGKKELSKKTA
ncbi:Protein of unknown function [Paenibacillus uliginis N3/975]|uniref:DUF4064 domain-containing protein n=1 Tax=Paenibacillus uliginis N3/975 TaxID=1313296 RepID=A0A1X7HLW6_9BACL|nr:DUF4064 domain-containing protein [Paenibacillus uliginis]SMF89037.1 Protein of unknown function [Paenibacillus uliginis N3/975]